MLSNLHTHTTYCDGKSTAEETVRFAIEAGFKSLGFSGHGYTPYDLRYCMQDVDGYIAEITALRKKYRDKIEIYLGTEEDSYHLCDRSRYDYIIGSSHYLKTEGKYIPVDSGVKYLSECIEACGSPVKFAEAYYSAFCDYIESRKPDIIGHFDLMTKYDEQEAAPLFSADEEYCRIAENYIERALKSDCFFEVNTGAMARGLRTSPYPSERLLNVIKKNGGKLVLSSDCHLAANLDFAFTETRKLLRDVGFEYVYVLLGGEFIKNYI